MNKIGRFKRPCATEAEFQSLADRPTLRQHETVALVQGLRPGRCLATYLDDYSGVVKLLLQAYCEGQLVDPVSPRQFVCWCDDNDIPLPEEFEERVRTRIFNLRRPKRPTTYTDERTWVLHTRRRPNRKGTTAVGGLEADICNRVWIYVINYIRGHGHLPKKHEVNKALKVQTGRMITDLDRCYNLKTCATPKEILAAKKCYRRSRYSQETVKPISRK